MESGRLYNKNITATHGTGLSESASSVSNIVGAPAFEAATVSSPHYSGDDDSHKTLTGPGGGDYYTSGTPVSHRWGHTAPSGSRVEINDTPGAERIEIMHHSGASLVIDPDGGVYVSSTSARGGGTATPFGDYYISAGGDIVIQGNGSVSIKTSGDLNIDVGGALNIRAGSYNLMTKAMDETIDGSASRSVTNDQSEVIGGLNRQSVAGDSRQQVSGTKITDVAGKHTVRVDGDYTNDVGGVATHTIKGNHTLQSSAKTKVLSSSDTTIDTGGNSNFKTGGSHSQDAGTDISQTAGANLVAVGGGQTSISGGSATTISSGGDTKLAGNVTAISGGAVTVDGHDVNIAGDTTSISGGTLALKSPNLLGTIVGSAGGPDTPSVLVQGALPGPHGPAGPAAATEAKTMEAKDIVDTLTSARKYPEYMGNGVTEAAYHTSVGMISHDTSPQAEDVYNEYSGGNQGSTNPSYVGGEYDTLSPDPVNRANNIESVDPGSSVPARYNNATKISKYFTLGDIVGAPLSWTIPADKWETVVKAHILLAVNVLDPLKKQFPEIMITNGYRNNSPNHVTGRAVDLVVPSRSLTKHAEIARFARDNLPVDQVFIERNDSGRTHVHLRVAEPGSKGAPSVLTCGDAKCISNVAGIQVEWLEKRVIV